MAIFDELTKKAQAAAEKAKDLAGAAAERAKDAAGAAAEKAKDAADGAKVKVAILSEQRELEKNYRAIGEWFVSEFQGEVPDAVKDVVAAIEASKARIAELKGGMEEPEEEPEAEAAEEPQPEAETPAAEEPQPEAEAPAAEE